MNQRNHNRKSNAQSCVKLDGVIVGGVMALLLTSCSDVVYDKSVDVCLSGWTPADSLFFPIDVQQEPDVKHPVLVNRVYTPSFSVRFTDAYAFSTFPFQVKVEMMDSLGIYRSMARYWEVVFPMTDAAGYLTGTSWGSTFQFERPSPKLQFRFDSPGSYRVVLLPVLDSEHTMVEGISSIGMSF